MIHIEPQNVLGAIELDSVAAGLAVLDAVTKKAPVRLLDVRTLCPGKYTIVFTGDEASVEASLFDGVQLHEECVLNWIYIPTLHREVAAALGGSAEEADDSIGVLESFSTLGAIEAGDIGAKSAAVRVIGIRFGDEMGGKSSVKFSGPLSEVEAAIESGSELLEAKQSLCKRIVIARPHADVVPHATKG